MQNTIFYIAIFIAIVLFLVIFFIKKTKKQKKDAKTFENTNNKKEEIDTKQKEKPEIKINQNTTDKEPKHTNIIKTKKKIKKEDFKTFKNLKILIAEDNLINQKVLKGIFSDCEIELVFANDGLEAVSFLKNQKDFDIILMDANMPNLDGLEATKKIREYKEFTKLPIIALSGDTASDDIKRMLNAGMDAHLAKPINLNELYDILKTFTDAKKPKIDILNIKKGIEISGGDEAFYKEILQEFLTIYSNENKKIKSLIEDKKIKEVDKTLLDIMGVISNIGANSVYEDTKKLKQLLQDSKDYKTALDKFYSSYNNLINEVKKYLNKPI